MPGQPAESIAGGHRRSGAQASERTGRPRQPKVLRVPRCRRQSTGDGGEHSENRTAPTQPGPAPQSKQGEPRTMRDFMKLRP